MTEEIETEKTKQDEPIPSKTTDYKTRAAQAEIEVKRLRSENNNLFQRIKLLAEADGAVKMMESKVEKLTADLTKRDEIIDKMKLRVRSVENENEMERQKTRAVGMITDAHSVEAVAMAGEALIEQFERVFANNRIGTEYESVNYIESAQGELMLLAREYMKTPTGGGNHDGTIRGIVDRLFVRRIDEKLKWLEDRKPAVLRRAVARSGIETQ